MAFATGEDLVNRYDPRLIADLVSDNGETLPVSEVPANTKVLASLDDASGEMLVALVQGGRYTESQVENLTGYGLSHRKRICCDIAMHLLIKRRPIVDEDKAAATAKQSREHLKSLATGENVFGIVEIIEAGQLELSAPSAIEIENLNLLPARCSRFFPETSQRMPRGQQ
jgi:phage gp36-like protein